MTAVTIGGIRLVLRAVSRDGRWLARAEREDNRDPFGVECAAGTEETAIARLTSWLEWQAEHTAALNALQQAERAYHRTIAGSAFVSPTEGFGAGEKESLNAVEAARVRLDEVRARQPRDT